MPTAENLPYFFFGTLMDLDVLAVVLGRPTDTIQWRAASVTRYRRVRVRGESYPVLKPSEGGTVDGLLVSRLSVHEMERVAYYEGDEYRLVRLNTICGGENQEALAFAEAEGIATDGAWDFAHWQREEKPALLETARAFMARFGEDYDRETVDARWLQAKAHVAIRSRS